MNVWFSLAQQPTPTPDTLVFMVAGYIVFWVIAFILLFSLSTRERNLEKDLEALRQVMEEDRQQARTAERKETSARQPGRPVDARG